MLGVIALHEFPHFLKKDFPVFVLAHIDEVDDNQSANIPQSQLSGNLLGSFKVYLEDGILLILSRNLGSAIHIDDMHRLGVFNNQVSTAVHGGGFAKRGFNLFGNSKSIK